MVYTKTIIHLSAGESGRYLPTLRLAAQRKYGYLNMTARDSEARGKRKYVLILSTLQFELKMMKFPQGGIS